MKILCISTAIFPIVADPKYAGIERLVRLIACELAKQGHEVSVAAPEGSKFPLGIAHINTGPLGDFVEGERKAYWRYSHLLSDFDAILSLDHSHFAMREHSDLPAIAFIWHTPFIMRPPLPNYNIASLSEFQKQQLLQYQNLSSRVIDPHCVEPNDYYPIQKGNGRMLFIGRLNPEKGVRSAIQICVSAGVGLNIIGGLGPGDPQEYLYWVLEHSDGKQIVYHGSVDDKTKFGFIAASSALLHTVSYPEVHSHKAMEAMSGGLPVIAFDIGANREIIEHGVTGFVASDDNEFYAYLRRIRELSKENIRDKSLKRWSVQVTAERLLFALEGVAKGERW